MTKQDIVADNQERWNSMGATFVSSLETNAIPLHGADWPMPITMEPLREILVNNPLDGKDVLDLGCGVGRLSSWLAYRGARVTSVDLGPDLVRATVRQAELNGLDILAAVCDARSLPFREQSFDVVIGAALLHHLTEENVAKVALAVKALLRPGGFFVVHEPLEDSAAFDWIQNAIPRHRPGHAMYRPSILNRKAWATHMEHVDDRAMRTREFEQILVEYRTGIIVRSGLTARIGTILPGKETEKRLLQLDAILLALAPPLQRFARNATAIYWV